jgi:hypothetical protein
MPVHPGALQSRCYANRLSLIGFPQSTRQRGEVVRKDPALLELNVQLAESNLLSGSPSV